MCIYREREYILYAVYTFFVTRHFYWHKSIDRNIITTDIIYAHFSFLVFYQFIFPQIFSHLQYDPRQKSLTRSEEYTALNQSSRTDLYQQQSCITPNRCCDFISLSSITSHFITVISDVRHPAYRT